MSGHAVVHDTETGSGQASAPDVGAPVIAVLPFENHIAEGEGAPSGISHVLAEEIAVGLTRIEGIDVLAGQIVNECGGRASDIGARYQVEGSIRKLGDRARVLVRVAVADTGRQLWADSYDEDWQDFVHNHDDLGNRLTAAVTAILHQIETTRVEAQDIDDLDSWSLTMRAYAGLGNNASKAQSEEAERLARKAVELDPTSGLARVVLAATTLQYSVHTEEGMPREKLREMCEEAIRLAPRDSMVMAIFGFVLIAMEELNEARDVLERAIEINPNNARALANYGRALRNLGHYAEAKEAVERALRLSPDDSMAYLWWSWLGSSLILKGDHVSAIDAMRQSIKANRTFDWGWMMIAAAYGLAGQDAEARAALAEAQRLRPDLTPENLEPSLRGSMGPIIDLSPFAKGLARAGLGEGTIMNKGMGIAGGLVVVAIAAFAFVAYSYLDTVLEALVEKYGTEMTAADVALDRASVSPTEGEGSLSGLTVGSPQGFQSENVLSLDDISLAIDPNTINSDVIVIKKIGVARPEITVELNKEGKTNLQALQQNVEDYVAKLSGGQGAPVEDSSQPAEPATETKMIVDEFRLTDGKVKLNATALGLGEAEALLPPIVLEDIGRPEGGITAAKVVEIILGAIETNAMAAVQGMGIAGLDQYLDRDTLIEKGLEKLGVELPEGAKDAIKGLFN
ncbi:cya3 [Symbiodinium microadriaticum]|nr:cya3 [Symbiodinium microadriaticum]